MNESVKPAQSTILAVDDDATFLRILQQAFLNQSITLDTAHSPQEAEAKIQQNTYGYAILDLNLEGQSGLNLLKYLLEQLPDCQVLILTGYASVATAVEAMRLGALDYLCKPASIDDILKALRFAKPDSANSEPTEEQPEADNPQDFVPMSVKRLEWEHIQKTLTEHDGNITLTAAALNMHRRTLQRKLQKRPVEK
ncbi:response regulator transcription factor [Thiosulfativibrio zosterae]|uniref:DNA-binding response regulator n=1 Tax=Thiosulfativibrio zosterae TaxID=2675053 RepID=A0A6F8PML8_9GAMM|nr:response regulator [Thiosulfativibrio zosterae]BBP43349.1 DNA-binding response regulator [Thiosulfativibrio zosterae]